jgi:iron uptake system component EfeO
MPTSAERSRKGPHAPRSCSASRRKAAGAAGATARPGRRKRRFATWLCALAAAGAGAAAPLLSVARAEALADSAEHYRPIMIDQIDQSLAAARLLRARLAAGDRRGAERAWIDSRIGWERSEVFTSGFVPDLDQEIDAWPNALLGFHAIEAKLFGAGRTDLGPETDALVLHLEDLDVKIHHLRLLPQRLLNGTARLAYEVGESKADGGESRFSGTSLNDMRNNVDGIAVAYRTIFAAAIEARDLRLAATIRDKIEALKAQVDVPDLQHLDPSKLRAASEELIVVLQAAAPEIGLRAPTLEEIAQ